MKIKKRFIGTKRSLLYTLTTILLVSLLSVAGYAWFRASQPQPENTPSDTTNYAPPTKEEVEAGQDAKKREEAKGSDTGQPTRANEDGNSQASANVLISSADVIGDTLEIRAFVNNHIEKGTCTATATKDGVAVRKSTTAFTDVSSSICPPMRIPTSKLSAGTWSITVSYSSNGLTGTSEAIEKRIP